ncbi:hypothetical protein J3D46_003032 [Paenarthrobacter sp. A20]|nr:hypothetical protein [Paenarthrobacter sp. A20]
MAGPRFAGPTVCLSWSRGPREGSDSGAIAVPRPMAVLLSKICRRGNPPREPIRSNIRASGSNEHPGREHPGHSEPRMRAHHHQQRQNPGFPVPTDIRTSRNHRSHWACSPGSQLTLSAGSASALSGRPSPGHVLPEPGQRPGTSPHPPPVPSPAPAGSPSPTPPWNAVPAERKKHSEDPSNN